MTIPWQFLGIGAQVFDPHLSIFLRPEVIHIGEDSRIDGMVKFEGGQGIWIGDGVHISSFVHLNIGGGSLHIGNYAALTSGARILSGSNTTAGQSMSSASPKHMQVVARKETIVDDYAIVAAGAVVLPGVRVGRYAVVGAGAVVTRDVPDYKVVLGIPARVMGDRRELPGWNYE